MKIAIISDIHGNLEALKATLKDIEKRNVDRIICLGDTIAKGIHPKECLDLIKENCEIVLQGNCDAHFSMEYEHIDKMPEQEQKRIKWNQSLINKEDREYLLKLPFCYEFYMSGRLVRLVHAHPQKIDKFAGNIDKLERLYELLLPSENTISDKKADVLIYGHIHTPYLQKIYNRFIINTGSVGNSIDVFRNDDKDGNVKNTTVANYLIISGLLNSNDINEPISYELVNVSYDIDKELSDNSDNIEFDSYSEELKKGKYRDMTKIYNSFEAREIDKDKI